MKVGWELDDLSKLYALTNVYLVNIININNSPVLYYNLLTNVIIITIFQGVYLYHETSGWFMIFMKLILKLAVQNIYQYNALYCNTHVF